MHQTITKNGLEPILKEATSTLLEMASNSCWNKISENTSYIISEIVTNEQDSSKKRIKRKKINDEKIPKSRAQIATELKKIYEMSHNN
jgi:hypothetical protein